MKVFMKLDKKYFSIKNKICGFTFAEVLITIGIIGVVAVLILPMLSANIQEQKFKTQAKALYSTVNQAAQFAKEANGGAFDSGHTTNAQLLDLFKPYLKYNKSCTAASTQRCFGAAGTYKRLNGSGADGAWIPNSAAVVLDSGAAVVMQTFFYSATCESTYPSSLKICGQIVMDVNAATLPNQFGVDTFIIYVTKDGIVPSGAQGVYGAYGNHVCPVFGHSCMANVLNNIDY